MTLTGIPGLQTSSKASTSRAVTVAVLAIWLATVIFTTTKHEYWRDEVRALSLVREAGSPLDLYGLIKYDGHPVLWYVLLYIGVSIVDSPLVLPVTSIAVAFVAVALFMVAAPFPFWMRTLFIFSALPFYEYTVMARNYGITMLLLFLAAVAYRTRRGRPLLLAAVLALLANTNAHSAMLACLIAAMWAWDIFADYRYGQARVRPRPLYLAGAIIAAGVLLSAAFAMPGEKTIVPTMQRPPSTMKLAGALLGAVVRPDRTFRDLMPGMVPSIVTGAALAASVIGLAGRPNLFLAALGAQIAFGLFFRVAFEGSYRHQGLFLMFLVFLYWVFLESRDSQVRLPLAVSRQLLLKVGLSAGLIVLILGGVARSRMAWADIHLEKSSSKAFAEFLRGSDAYGDAIIVPEPDFMLESLPYYAGNPIYFPRERRFGTTVSWTTDPQRELSLGDVLSSAREIRARHERPVLIVLGRWDLDRHAPGEHKDILGKVFSWTAEELAAFRIATRSVAAFEAGLGDESYRVYVLEN